MSQLEVSKAEAAEERSEQTRSFVRTVKAAARRKYTPEEKIRIVMEGFRREVTVNDLCRREGIKPHSYYSWTKELVIVYLTQSERRRSMSGCNAYSVEPFKIHSRPSTYRFARPSNRFLRHLHLLGAFSCCADKVLQC